MKTEQELIDLISLGENDRMEFKISVPSKVRDLSEEICAFANSEGGLVLVGIDDDGNIKGTEISNSKRSAIQNSINGISPEIDCEYYPVTVGGKEIWVIDVKEGDEKPYFVSGAVYVRKGACSQKITNANEVRELFAQSGQLHFDAKIERNYDLIANLDDETVQEFRLKSGISPVIDNRQMLENFDLFTKDGIPLAAGIMFFCKNVAKKYFQAVTRCVLFKGTDRVHIIDDKSFGGSLLSQYENANSWVKSKLQVEYIIEGSGPRKEIWDIPLEVIREALVNALCHRDYYETGSVTMVEIYDDRVSITNPGGMLPVVQKNFGHLSKSRNPKIFELFTRMHLVEKVGSGIPRMIEAMKNAGLPEPDFNYDGEHFFITFKKRELDKVPDKVSDENSNNKLSINDGLNDGLNGGLNFSEIETLKLIAQNPSITAKEISESIGVKIRQAERIVSSLKAQGKIERVGAKKNGYWKIIKK